MPKKLPDILLTRRTAAVSAEWLEVMEDLTSALKLVDSKVRCDITVATRLGWLACFIDTPSKLIMGRDTRDRMRISLIWIAKRIEDTVKTDQQVITFNESEFAKWQLQNSPDAKEAVNVPMSSSDSVSAIEKKLSAVPERQLAEAKSKKAAASEKKSSVAKASSKKALPDLHLQMVPIEQESMAITLEERQVSGSSEWGSDDDFRASTSDSGDVTSKSVSKASSAVNEPQIVVAVTAVQPPPPRRGPRGYVAIRDYVQTVLAEMTDSGDPIAPLAAQVVTLLKLHVSRAIIKPIRLACAVFKGDVNTKVRGKSTKRSAELNLRIAIETVNKEIKPKARASVEGWLTENTEALRAAGFNFSVIYGPGGKPVQTGSSVAVESTPSSSGPQQQEDPSSDPVDTVQEPIDEGKRTPPVSKAASRKAKKLASRVGASTRSTRVVRKTARVKRAVTRRSKKTSSSPVDYATTSADQAVEVKSSSDVPPEQVEMISQAVEDAEEIHRLHRGQPRVDNNTIGSGTGATTPRGYEAVAKRERRIKLAKEAQQAATARREFDQSVA